MAIFIKPRQVVWNLTRVSDWPLWTTGLLESIRRNLDKLYETLWQDFYSRPFCSNMGLAAITITGAATTGVWTLPVVEVDTSYMVVVTPASSTGAPAAGSNRILSYTKTVTAVTITLEAAPAGVATVTFDLATIRTT